MNMYSNLFKGLKLGLMALPLAFASGIQAASVAKEITFIHVGDIHGHLIPRAHMRSDGNGVKQGGLARMYTVIEDIRADHKNSLFVNTGDTIQGSAEALFTKGEAVIDVLNMFHIDFYAAGNWDYVYGTEQFIKAFVGEKALAPWGALAANIYYDGEPYADKTGQRVMEPYKIVTIDGVKIGVLGFSSERGPTVVGPDVAKGFRYSRGEKEMAEFVPMLRKKVDLLVVISELGLAGNMRLAEETPGIDLVLSSDMHEETKEAVRLENGTVLVEEGQDGTRVGELTAKFDANNKYVGFDYKMHVVDASVAENPKIAAKIAEVRKAFVRGKDFTPHTNPINGTVLNTPIDKVVGQTKVALHRSNFAHEKMPAAIEGSSHDFLSDAFKTEAKADLGLIRGFRYGTHIAPGPILLEDLYHYIAVGPFVAKGEVTGAKIRKVIEESADGTLNPNPLKWSGGWLFAWSGLKYDLNPAAEMGKKSSNIQVFNQKANAWEPLKPTQVYSVAGYNFDSEPGKVNKVPADKVQQVRGADGKAIDGVQVVVNYLKDHVVDPELNRVHLSSPLPKPVYKSDECQPLHGVHQ